MVLFPLHVINKFCCANQLSRRSRKMIKIPVDSAISQKHGVTGKRFTIQLYYRGFVNIKTVDEAAGFGKKQTTERRNY